jgi:adenylate kinase family enzyme
MGSGGAGNSWLAERLSPHLAIPAIDPDAIYWEPGGYRSLSAEIVREASTTDRWVIEGVCGRLVREASLYFTALVWLDIDERESYCELAAMRDSGRRR